MGGIEKGCEWRLGAIFDKIETGNPEISLINYIDNLPNPTINNMPAITDSGANIHLAKKATPTMAPITILVEISTGLLDGNTM